MFGAMTFFFGMAWQNSGAECGARTGSVAPSAPAKRGRGTTGARVASEPWWRGRWTRSFVFVAEDSLRRKKRANMSGHHQDTCGTLSPAPPPPPLVRPPSPALAVAEGASRFAGAISPMVNRALTSGLLCYAGAAAGGPAVMMYRMTGDTPLTQIGAKASRATGSRSPFVRLRELIDRFPPGQSAISLAVGEPQHPIPPFVGPVIAAHVNEFGRYPANKGLDE